MKYTSELEPAHSGRRKRLLRSFETLESFRDEYRRNISNGGIFIESDKTLAVRELVDIILKLEWRDERVPLEGEVVRRVPAGLSDSLGQPGVAVQFLATPPEIRERLQELADMPAASARREDMRRDERKQAQVDGRLEGEQGRVVGRTRNLSQSGVLLAVDAGALPVGATVRVSLKHPTTGETRELEGSVVRAANADSDQAEIAVEFEPDAGSDDFIASVQSAEHARALGAIGGPIGSLGLANLLQMFSSCAEQGQLVLERADERAIVGFASGNLTRASLGNTRGVKALARLFAWTEGMFEFHEGDAPDAFEASPLPIYGAVMEAMTQMDELSRLDLTDLPPETRLELDLEVFLDASGDLDKIELALVSRMSEGEESVGTLLDLLPAFDAEIYAALIRLRERGAIIVRS